MSFLRSSRNLKKNHEEEHSFYDKTRGPVHTFVHQWGLTGLAQSAWNGASLLKGEDGGRLAQSGPGWLGGEAAGDWLAGPTPEWVRGMIKGQWPRKGP